MCIDNEGYMIACGMNQVWLITRYIEYTLMESPLLKSWTDEIEHTILF